MEEINRFAILARSGRLTVTDLSEQFSISRKPATSTCAGSGGLAHPKPGISSVRCHRSRHSIYPMRIRSLLSRRVISWSRWRFYEALTEVGGLIILLASFGFQTLIKDEAQGQTQFWRDQYLRDIHAVTVGKRDWPIKYEALFPYGNTRFQDQSLDLEEESGVAVAVTYAFGSALLVISRVIAHSRPKE